MRLPPSMLTLARARKRGERAHSLSQPVVGWGGFQIGRKSETHARMSRPVPPSASGIAMPIRPSSPICLTVAAGNQCSLSTLAWRKKADL